MPFVKQINSKGLRYLNSRRIFIGRKNALQFFAQNILKPDYPTHNIISISGQGGVGKSTLLAQFIEIANADEFRDFTLTALVDEHQITPASIMEKFAEQLHIAGEFEKASRLYKDALRKLQTEQDTARESLSNKVASDLTGTVVKGVPGIGPLLEKEAGTAIGYLMGEIRFRQRLKDAERLEDPIANLTKAFITELNILATETPNRRRRVILFFDTFEQLTLEATPWLLDYLLQANISTNVVLVVIGRDPVERSTPGETRRWLPYFDNNTLYSIFLESFTQTETSEYLIARGITDPDEVSVIWQLSQGLPLYLSLLTFDAQGKLDPTADVVANYLRWIPEHDQVKRKLALDAALLSKPFDLDDMDAFKYLPENDKFTFYQWLITLPFIQSIPQDGRYNYHILVKQLFCLNLYQRSQKEYYNTRRSLADYYQQLLEKTQKEFGSEIYSSSKWIEFVLALVYQLFSLPDEDSHIHAIEQVLAACMYKKETGDIAKILRSVFNEQPNNINSLSAQQTARKLLRYIEIDSVGQPQEKIEIINDLLDKLINSTTFSPDLLGRIYIKRASIYITQNENQNAIVDLNHALVLNPKNTSVYVLRGNLFLLVKEFDKALSDFDQAIASNSEDAQTYISRAQIYIYLKELQRSLENLNQALKMDSKRVIAYTLRGSVYLMQNEYGLAMKDLDKALELDPSFFLAYLYRSQAYFILKKPQKAIKDVNQMIEGLDPFLEKHPKLAYMYLLQGQAYHFLNKHQLALKSVDYALELDPNLAHAYHMRGLFNFSINKHHQAIDDLDRALELDPNFADAVALRGNIYMRIKDYQHAINDLNRAIELQPKNIWAYTIRSRIHFELNEYEQAIQDLDQALELSPKDTQIMILRGHTHNSFMRYEQAIQDFDRLLELTPKDTQIMILRGRAYIALKQFDQALQDFNRVVHLNPKDAQALTFRGQTHYFLQQPEQAMKDLNRALVLNPKSSEAYTFRGLIYLDSKKPDQAKQDLDRALSLDPKNAPTYGARAMYFISQHKFQEADEDINQSFALDSNNALAHAARGFININNKDYHFAVNDFDHFIEFSPKLSQGYYQRGLAYLLLKDIKHANEDFARSWELDPKVVDYGWATEWSNMCLKSNDPTRIERLRRIAAIEPQIPTAHICQGVALWLSQNLERAIAEFKLAISLNSQIGGAYFWLGMTYASLKMDTEALESMEKSMAVDGPVPPVLLVLLNLLKQERQDFYEKHALSFLDRHS